MHKRECHKQKFILLRNGAVKAYEKNRTMIENKIKQKRPHGKESTEVRKKVKNK